MTNEELLLKMHEYVKSLDTKYEDAEGETEAEQADRVLEGFLGFAGLPPLTEATPLSSAEARMRAAYFDLEDAETHKRRKQGSPEELERTYQDAYGVWQAAGALVRELKCAGLHNAK